MIWYDSRSDREFLYQILGEVIKAGATTLNIPDTVGITMPSEFGKLIADIKANTPGVENVIISTHCQNDLGLSTANTIEVGFPVFITLYVSFLAGFWILYALPLGCFQGARAGARQLEVTINGIGERAGNASLEEVRANHMLFSWCNLPVFGNSFLFSFFQGCHGPEMRRTRL